MFILPLYDRQKPFFDTYFEGILLNSKNEIEPNKFVNGVSLQQALNSKFYLKIDDAYSEIGVLKDRLVTIIYGMPLFVVSKHIKNLFDEHFPVQAEFFEVEFIWDRLHTNVVYYICNIVNKVDCINYDASDFGFESEFSQNPKIYYIDKLTVDNDKIPKEIDIFLIDNLKKPTIIVSDNFKRKIEDNNSSGFLFLKPGDFVI